MQYSLSRSATAVFVLVLADTQANAVRDSTVGIAGDRPMLVPATKSAQQSQRTAAVTSKGSAYIRTKSQNDFLTNLVLSQNNQPSRIFEGEAFGPGNGKQKAGIHFSAIDAATGCRTGNVEVARRIQPFQCSIPNGMLQVKARSGPSSGEVTDYSL